MVVQACNPSTWAGELLTSKANLVGNAVEASQDYIARTCFKNKNKNKATNLKVGMVVHNCDPSSWVAEAELP